MKDHLQTTTFLLLVFCTRATESWSWNHPVVSSAEARPHVSGHSVATASANDHQVWLFGGLTGAAGSPVTDDLWSYTAAKGWNLEKAATASKCPGPRMYGASAMLEGSLFLFEDGILVKRGAEALSKMTPGGLSYRPWSGTS